MSRFNFESMVASMLSAYGKQGAASLIQRTETRDIDTNTVSATEQVFPLLSVVANIPSSFLANTAIRQTDLWVLAWHSDTFGEIAMKDAIQVNSLKTKIVTSKPVAPAGDIIYWSVVCRG